MRLATKCQAQRDFTPVSWRHYFDEAHDIHLNKRNETATRDQQEAPDSFRVYVSNFRPPYAPERRAGHYEDTMSETEFKQYEQYPTLVLLHGGGYSGLTWAEFTRSIERECHCRIMAIDLRNHGDTKTGTDEKMDIDTLVEDVVQIIHATHHKYNLYRLPKLILVGHSMGGAIAIKCSTRCLESLPTLAGFVIIDVVEGTAKDALPLMMSVIKTRPNKFPSLQNAIEWSFRSGMAKNLDAARVSMPGNLVNMSTGHLGIHDIIELSEQSYQSPNIERHKFHISIENLIKTQSAALNSMVAFNSPLPARVASLRESSGGFPRLPTTTTVAEPTTISAAAAAATDSLIEEEEECDEPVIKGDNDTDKMQKQVDESQLDSDGYRRPPSLDESGYCWRTDLAKTQPYWPGWFEGLSQQMLDAPVQGKFLLLAGIDRLDKTLTIGQMQGKFMMKVLPKCGHAVHEDSPEHVATEIAQFLVRNKFTSSISG